MSVTAHYVLECLESQALFVQSLISYDKLDIQLQCDEDLVWNFDQTLVNTAIRNAAMNALRYAKTKLQFSAKISQNFLQLQIADDGPGYPDHMLGKTLEKATTIDLDTRSTGLGLYFAEKVASMHTVNAVHGYLQLANNLNLPGAAVVLYIP